MAVEFLSGARAPREISRTANPNPTSIRGTSGARVVGGYLQSNEKNSDLVGQQRYVTWSDMIANTSIIAAGARYYLNLLAKANWTLDPADDSAVAEKLAERTFNIIHNMRRPWSRVVRAAGMYRFYGFSVQEWTAKREEDGTFGLLDIATRPQNTIEQWDTEADGNVVGCTQKDPNSFEFIYLPRAKTIYVVDDALTDTP
jgi:alkylated DNA nucleotide flippase Atl1